MKPMIVTRDVLHQRLLDLFADIFQADVQPGISNIHRADVSEWDSVNHLRLVMELEEQYGVTLSDEDVLSINSLNDVESLVLRVANANHPAA